MFKKPKLKEPLFSKDQEALIVDIVRNTRADLIVKIQALDTKINKINAELMDFKQHYLNTEQLNAKYIKSEAVKNREHRDDNTKHINNHGSFE